MDAYQKAAKALTDWLDTRGAEIYRTARANGATDSEALAVVRKLAVEGIGATPTEDEEEK